MKKKGFWLIIISFVILIHAIIEIHDGFLYGKAGKTSINFDNHPLFFSFAIAFEFSLGMFCLLYGVMTLLGIKCKWIEMINKLDK